MSAGSQRAGAWTLALELAITFLGLMAVTFLIGRIMPIDPVVAAAGADLSAAQHARIKAEMGLDQPLIVQFGQFIVNLFRLDFGFL